MCGSFNMVKTSILGLMSILKNNGDKKNLFHSFFSVVFDSVKEFFMLWWQALWREDKRGFTEVWQSVNVFIAFFPIHWVRIIIIKKTEAPFVTNVEKLPRKLTRFRNSFIKIKTTLCWFHIHRYLAFSQGFCLCRLPPRLKKSGQILLVSWIFIRPTRWTTKFPAFFRLFRMDENLRIARNPHHWGSYVLLCYV